MEKSFPDERFAAILPAIGRVSPQPSPLQFQPAQFAPMKTNFTTSLRFPGLPLILCCCATTLRAEQFGLFTYQVVGETVITITDYDESAAGPAVIPAEISGKPVTSIGDAAFRDCPQLTGITIPPGVTHIGNHAFSLCTGLTSVTIPSGVSSFGGHAFSSCTGLTSVTLPFGVSTIGQAAFYGCSSLTSVTIPSSVTSIYSGTFRLCGALTNITIPSSVTSIGSFAFEGCTSLTSVTIPASVTSIGTYAFAGAGLTSVTLPSSVTSISDYTFYFCTALTTVTIPSSVTSIGAASFFNCTALTDLTISAGVVSIGGAAFMKCTRLTSVTIPASVSWIGDHAFHECRGLLSAVFLGDAPILHLGYSEFTSAGPGFRVHYLSGRSGFSSPTWHVYPATMIDEAIYPAGVWLVTHGYGHDASLQQDTDGDGVNLLMAYALNLDPRLNLKSTLPQPELGADSLRLSFYAVSPGITYRVETSTNLQNWTAAGVTQTAPDSDQRSTATVSRDLPQRFLRLVVED